MYVLVMFDIKEFGKYRGKEGNQRIDNRLEVVQKLGRNAINYRKRGVRPFVLRSLVTCYISTGVPKLRPVNKF